AFDVEIVVAVADIEISGRIIDRLHNAEAPEVEPIVTVTIFTVAKAALEAGPLAVEGRIAPAEEVPFDAPLDVNRLRIDEPERRAEVHDRHREKNAAGCNTFHLAGSSADKQTGGNVHHGCRSGD